MKTTINLIALVFTMLFFSACEEAEELTIFHVNDTFVVEAAVDIPEDPNGNSQNFEYSSEINIRENSEIDNYFGNIQYITINSLNLRISDFVANQNVIAEDVVVTIGDVIIPLGDIDLASYAASDELIQVGNSQQLSQIAEQLLNSANVTVGFVGTVNDTPVSFTGTLFMSIRVTVNII